jgi:glycosyltransferase involved in cell wall biosynthesis
MAGDFTPCHRPHGWSCLFWHYAQRCGGKNPLGNWERWHKAESRSALKSAPLARVQVASEFMRRSLLENCYDADRIDVVPLFAVPSSVSVATEPGLLLVACRLVRSKGVHLLLQALGRSAALPWRLVIAGNGPELDRLRQTAGELGLSDRVNFLGELSSTDLAAWYARASIIISPTLRPEPFGLVGPEAMAHGKPVIAFAGGAHSEWLIDGETGVLVRERTAEALAKAIRDLLQSSERCAEMGARARKRWEQFHPEIYVGRVVASFERCRSDFASASSGGHA